MSENQPEPDLFEALARLRKRADYGPEPADSDDFITVQVPDLRALLDFAERKAEPLSYANARRAVLTYWREINGTNGLVARDVDVLAMRAAIQAATGGAG